MQQLLDRLKRRMCLQLIFLKRLLFYCNYRNCNRENYPLFSYLLKIRNRHFIKNVLPAKAILYEFRVNTQLLVSFQSKKSN